MRFESQAHTETFSDQTTPYGQERLGYTKQDKPSMWRVKIGSLGSRDGELDGKIGPYLCICEERWKQNT